MTARKNWEGRVPSGRNKCVLSYEACVYGYWSGSEWIRMGIIEIYCWNTVEKDVRSLRGIYIYIFKRERVCGVGGASQDNWSSTSFWYKSSGVSETLAATLD